MMLFTSKTTDPIIYDIWDHYEILRNHLNWLTLERPNLVKYIPASAINYEIMLTRILMQKLEKKMLIEFVGDILNLSIVQKETFHYIIPPTVKTIDLEPSEYIIRTY